MWGRVGKRLRKTLGDARASLKPRRADALRFPTFPTSPDRGVEHDKTNANVLRDRDAFRRVIHLYGDSLFRGHGLGRLPEAFSTEEILTDPLWPLRSPAATVNLLLSETDPRHAVDAYGSVVSGSDVAIFAGLSGQPDQAAADQTSAAVKAAIRLGHIRPSDVLVFADAGLHDSDPDAYQARWEQVRRAASDVAVTILIMDMFDYVTHLEIGGHGADEYRYDVAFDGSRGGGRRTMNEATRAAAVADMPGAARTILVPLNAAMDRRREKLAENYRLPVVDKGGVHANVWGQCVMVGALLQAAGLRPRPAADGAFASIIRKNWKRLRYSSRSSNLSAEAAVKLAVELVSGDLR